MYRLVADRPEIQWTVKRDESGRPSFEPEQCVVPWAKTNKTSEAGLQVREPASEYLRTVSGKVELNAAGVDAARVDNDAIPVWKLSWRPPFSHVLWMVEECATLRYLFLTLLSTADSPIPPWVNDVSTTLLRLWLCDEYEVVEVRAVPNAIGLQRSLVTVEVGQSSYSVLIISPRDRQRGVVLQRG